MNNGIIEQFVIAFFDPKNLVGHVAYVLLIVSMLMRNMRWLRIFAICAGSVSAVYYWAQADYVSVFWESIFTLVNVIQLFYIAIENSRGRFSKDERYFIETCLPGLERAQARRFMKLGAWTQVSDETILISEDTCPQRLKFVVDGVAKVTRKSKHLGKVSRGDFLGEMSYLTGQSASASVIAETTMRYLAFDRDVLKEHLTKNPEVRFALESSFNRNLVEKLVKTNDLVRPETEAEAGD
ncbi:MAG: cyclic nucleotide-binding domain-containing protein [Rhizobiaceae bacterium]